MLAAKGRKGLKAEAMRELGNIHFHAKNVRWCLTLCRIILNVVSEKQRSINECKPDWNWRGLIYDCFTVFCCCNVPVRRLSIIYNRLASKWWCESLDSLTNITDAVKQWRHAFRGSSDIARDLLQRCGLWGCLIGGIVCSNIAQLVHFIYYYFFFCLIRRSSFVV